MAEEIMVDR